LNDEYAAPSGYKTPMYQEIASQNAFAFLSEDDITQLEWQLNHISAGASEFECTVSVNGKRGPVIVNLSLFFELNEDGDYLIRVYSKETEDLPLRTTVTQKQVATPKPHRVEIRTFGYFELFVDEKPVYLKSAKAREMLAVLVDRRGGFVSPSSIISNLWENESANKVTLTRCRKTFKTLTDELKAYGIDDIVESHNGQRRIVPEKVKCDYFEYNTGKPQYQYLFKGSYLTEYSWAETTLAELMMAKEG
ncbi:MAG: hypothetical protein Q4B78_04410, partial [Bacillota bacterium]|nr:hypothetical protein [Bacillota bacterium]